LRRLTDPKPAVRVTSPLILLHGSRLRVRCAERSAPHSGIRTSAERVCKPDSVPEPRGPGGDHSSSPAVARRIQQPTRELRPGRPRTLPYSVLLRAGFAVPVVSPRRRCALTAPFHPCHPRSRGSSAVCFLWHFPWGRPRWRLASALPFGVRTFLPGPDVGPRRSPDPLRERPDYIVSERIVRAPAVFMASSTVAFTQ
jgi:hypothetical protein